MAKPRPLTPAEAKKTLANRFIPAADRLRQLATSFGIRPYRTFLVWTRWSGAERGEGEEVVVRQVELLPTPKVTSLDSVTFSVFHAGTLPVGSVKLENISGSYTEDQLRGLAVPQPHEEHIPEPYGFFYEIVEDGRGDPEPHRAKFRLLSTPMRRAGSVDWTLMLERISQDRTRAGKSAIGTGEE